MCSICGIFDMQGQAMASEQVLQNMMQALHHRGPDGSNFTILPGLALGFNRLSFVDLEGGMQPLYNEAKTLTMICNGEIYNHQALRRELREKGHVFSTHTDVEVILHLYEEYGLDFPNHLNGQFAIALYDHRLRQLLLVRDQIGICPLFYTQVGHQIVFASEIKGILEYPGVERKLNLKAVDQLLNFPGIVSPTTFFQGIHALEAGHMLRLQVGQEMENLEYWDLQYGPEEEDMGEAYYVERLQELLKQAISRRLIADVPIGFYISGGLDSSMVACYIGKYMLDSAYSFSAEIGSGDLDESRFQKLVRECVGSTHYVTKVTEAEIWEYLSQVVYQAESAVKESYDVAAFLLSDLVRRSPAKAVLTGQGSDEFFCGYVGYMVDQFRFMQKKTMTQEECECNERLWGDPYFRFERNHPQIHSIHAQLYHPDVRGEWDKFSALAKSPLNLGRVKGLTDARRRSYIDYKLRLSDHLLGEHGDRMFAVHSVEGRHPFLDMELLNFVITIPDKYKLNGTDEKYILKKAGKGIVPDEILNRKKFPFQAPGMSAMVKRPHMGKNFLDETLIQKHGVFDVAFVRKLQAQYAQEDFQLMGAYDIDYLLIVLTVTMLCEAYSLRI